MSQEIEKLVNNIILRRGELNSYAKEHYDVDSLLYIENLFKQLANKEQHSNLDILKLQDLENCINSALNEHSSEMDGSNLLSAIKALVPTQNEEQLAFTLLELQQKIKNIEDKINQSPEGNYDNISEIIKTELKGVEQFYKDVQEGIFSLDQKLEDVEKKEHILAELESVISRDINKQNFELLSKGFQTILSEKKTEKNTFVKYLVFFGLVMMFIPIFALIAQHKQWTLFTELSGIVPLIAIELFAIYFFKIFLHNYSSLKEQMLQIDTKRSLLGFISDYIRYKESNKISDTSIDKLEEIIFSKISPDMKQVPVAPDLVSIIEKILKAIGKGQGQ
ncbi:MAG: hypothetical protein PHV10_07060 [Sulfuricurvum sp.]|nr:hypothetical protein [Sulfuricurvum sp.]